MQIKNEEWFREEEFWEQFAPIMFDDAHWAEVPAVADAITRLSRFDLYGETSETPLPSNPKILDVCCGFGRMSAELARRDFAVTGVDITESYLRTAREEASYENLNIEYIHCDAREFKRPGYFDAAVNLYISFGYFSKREDDLCLSATRMNPLNQAAVLSLKLLARKSQSAILSRPSGLNAPALRY